VSNPSGVLSSAGALRTAAIVAALIALLGPSKAGAVVSHVDRFTLRSVPHPVTLDPSLSDPLWADAGITGNGTFFDLTRKSAASYVTNAYVLYDASNLYVGFHCEQSAPVTATQSVNAVGFGLDDFVGIGIDTTSNGSQVYYFETTPRGVRYQQSSENARYQPDWQSVARIRPNGWDAEMIIPLSAIRMPAAREQTWRINFVRNISALNEHYSWAYEGLMQDGPVPQWPSTSDARFWPQVSGIVLASSAHAARPRARADVYGLQSVGGDRTLFAQADGSFRQENVRTAGIDFSLPLTNTINLVGTADPDFSNVEIDQQTIAPQEFRRNLSEYRPFFSQGAQFINPNTSPSAGFFTPNNAIFYSPGVGPFDRGAKIEGTAGKQAFGVLSFRGYDQTTGDEFDDLAYGYKHASGQGVFSYWSDGVFAHHSAVGDDATVELGFSGMNPRTGINGGADGATERRRDASGSSSASSVNVYGGVNQANWTASVRLQNITPQYAPFDGFTIASDVRGIAAYATTTGNLPRLKNYTVVVGGDRFVDQTGAPHETDEGVQISAALPNQWSINNVGAIIGSLRGYAAAPLGPQGCADPSLPRTYYTGFPDYLCGRNDRFNTYGAGIGYRDGTPNPTDVSYNAGPFGGFFVHQFVTTASRQIGTRYSVSLEYDGTQARNDLTGSADSQWLRRLSIGESLGPDSNVSLSIRSISGFVNGLTALPGSDVAASYHKRFSSDDELFVSFGTPASTQTLDRFILKYVVHFGAGAGT